MPDIDEQPSCAIIVDAYSTGKHLAPLLTEQGLRCIHIKSHGTSPNLSEEALSHFVAQYVYEDSISTLLENIACYKVTFCIPGSESGVNLADTICHELGIIGNDIEKSLARRDKYKMIDAVKTAGLQVPEHIESSELAPILAWSIEQQKWPVVIKPLASANGDHVFFCHNDFEVTNAFEKVRSSVNLFGEPNDKVLAETYTQGEEYIVNSVSWNNQHYIAEIWHVKRESESTIYDYAIIIDKTDPAFAPIKSYVSHVLNALGIQYGAGTTELKYSPEQGATLIETSARLMSGAPITFSTTLFGYTQLSLLVEAYTQTSNFIERCQADSYSPNYYGMIIVMRSLQDGIILKEASFITLNTLISFFGFAFSLKPGGHLVKTIDSLTTPGEVYLLSDNISTLFHDKDTFRLMEQDLYNQLITEEHILTPV